MPKNNNNHKQSPPGKSRPRRVNTTGPSASNTIFKRMGDQVSRVVRNRYGGQMGLSKLTQDVSMLMGVVNTEEKNVDQLTGLTTVDTTNPYIAAILPPIQSLTGSGRIGDSILVNRIDLQIRFAYSTGTPATTSLQTQTFRWHLVRYLKTPSGGSGTGAFATADYLNVDSNGNFTPMSAPNSDLAEDFIVMETGLIELDLNLVTAGTSSVQKIIDISKPCHFHQTFTGSAVGTIVDNCVFLVFTALNASNTGGLSQIALTTRMFYIDN